MSLILTEPGCGLRVFLRTAFQSIAANLMEVAYLSSQLEWQQDCLHSNLGAYLHKGDWHASAQGLQEPLGHFHKNSDSKKDED